MRINMLCPYQNSCGGCPLRNLSDEEYHRKKTAFFQSIIDRICQDNIQINNPIYINDGLRRRAEFTFTFSKRKLHFGFNIAKCHDLVDINHCLSLTPKINANIDTIRIFLQKMWYSPDGRSQVNGKAVTEEY